MKNIHGLEVRGHFLENAHYDLDTLCDFFSCSFSFGAQKGYVIKSLSEHM